MIEVTHKNYPADFENGTASRSDKYPSKVTKFDLIWESGEPRPNGGMCTDHKLLKL
jgi:hypothetical protein